MRKLVLGILALISVQFAFVTYMMVLQPPPVELTDARIPTQPAIRYTRLAPIDHFTSSTGVESQPEVADSAGETRHSRAKIVATNIVPERVVKLDRPSVRYASKPAFSATPSRSAAPDEFETVVISYNRKLQTSNCDTIDTPKAIAPETPIIKTKKRSYLAKASPVIKKPWEWIKTVASKFN